MIQIRKVRGHHRRWTDIDNWVERNKGLDLEYLKSQERDYAKIWVHPWSGISITNSEMAQPSGITKRRILQGLITIYNEWNIKLASLDEPYYLKIWLYDPNFSRSQVVCAIGNALDFYETTFYKPDEQKSLNPPHYGKLSDQMAAFDWEYHWDEFHFSPDDLGEPDDYASLKDYQYQKKWMTRLMQKPLRKTGYENTDGEFIESFAHREGTVWVGGQQPLPY
ncbi:MAG: hypothetical protein HEP71_03915 [Roseivirga sp.]|nr:hypothetical protein [Roseivirga sp.]